MSAVVLHVIQAMKFQVAEMTIYPLSYNKTNCDHLIYEPQDTQYVFKNILKTGSNFCLCVTNFGLGLLLQED